MSAAAPTISPGEAQKLGDRKKTENPSKDNEGKNKPSTSEESRWRPVLGLPCQLTVDLPLLGCKVADFLALRPGSVLGTNWRLAQDVPLRINGTLIAWAEF